MKNLIILIVALNCAISFAQIEILHSTLSMVDPIDSLDGNKFKNIIFQENEYMVLKFDSMVLSTDIFVDFYPGQQTIGKGLVFEFYNDDIYNFHQTPSHVEQSTFEAHSFSICKIYAMKGYWVNSLEFNDVKKYDASCKPQIIEKEVYIYNTDTIYFDNCNTTNLEMVDYLGITYNNNYLYIPESVGDVRIFNISGQFVENYSPGEHYLNETPGIYVITGNNLIQKILIQ